MNDKLFCYLVDFGNVTAGSTYTGELPFDGDSDFQIRNIRSNLSATTEAKITITKAGGEQFSNAAFELRALVGVNNSLNVLDDITITRGTKWTISANVSAGNAQPLQLQFWGIKR